MVGVAANLLLEAFAGPQVQVREGPAWALELRIDACPEPATAPTEPIVATPTP